MPTTKKPLWNVFEGDCISYLTAIPQPPRYDLVFADPPYNIGYEAYDSYDDNRSAAEYLAWCSSWIWACLDVVRPTGAFWIAIGDEYVSELDCEVKKYIETNSRLKGWCKRSHVVWYYTFGVACQQNFSRSHTHLLYYAHKDSKQRTFNPPRVPSARQLVYNDSRANSKGKLPDNTWVLNPLDLAKAFTRDEDTWLESRVCGTFGERGSRGEYQVSKGVPQMPLAVMERIIAASSNPGDLVLDPFCGTGSTGVAAVKLGRRFIGMDISARCVELSKRRINDVV